MSLLQQEPDKLVSSRQLPAFPIDESLARFSALSLPERAAAILAAIAPAIQSAPARDASAQFMDQLLKRWLSDGLPASERRKLNPLERESDEALRLILQEAFAVLVLTRMILRVEELWAGQRPYYRLGPDGRLALERDDAAEVIARRLPE